MSYGKQATQVQHWSLDTDSRETISFLPTGLRTGGSDEFYFWIDDLQTRLNSVCGLGNAVTQHQGRSSMRRSGMSFAAYDDDFLNSDTIVVKFRTKHYLEKWQNSSRKKEWLEAGLDQGFRQTESADEMTRHVRRMCSKLRE
mmetsp:Transcript_20413/g.24509  ORF Transcript_20413/g.24509 Transcript_20413/m.24509 type:complete len:142 (-) Transcript_20413:77-502(-)